MRRKVRLTESELRRAIANVLNNTRKRTTRGVVNEVISTFKNKRALRESTKQVNLTIDQTDRIYDYLVDELGIEGFDVFNGVYWDEESEQYIAEIGVAIGNELDF